MFLVLLPCYVTLGNVAPPHISVGSWFLQTRMEKTRLTVIAVDMLGKWESMSVDVQYVCHTRH